jgi:hypothetical protein
MTYGIFISCSHHSVQPPNPRKLSKPGAMYKRSKSTIHRGHETKLIWQYPMGKTPTILV